MMTPWQEKKFASEIRLLARQYCDGDFSKAEYRRLRRKVLEECIQDDVTANTDSEMAVQPPKGVWKLWMLYGILLASATVLGVLAMTLPLN